MFYDIFSLPTFDNKFENKFENYTYLNKRFQKLQFYFILDIMTAKYQPKNHKKLLELINKICSGK